MGVTVVMCFLGALIFTVLCSLDLLGFDALCSAGFLGITVLCSLGFLGITVLCSLGLLRFPALCSTIGENTQTIPLHNPLLFGFFAGVLFRLAAETTPTEIKAAVMHGT